MPLLVRERVALSRGERLYRAGAGWLAALLCLAACAGPTSQTQTATPPSLQTRGPYANQRDQAKASEAEQNRAQPVTGVRGIKTTRRLPAAEDGLRARARLRREAERQRRAMPQPDAGRASRAVGPQQPESAPQASQATASSTDEAQSAVSGLVCCPGVPPLSQEALRLVSAGNELLKRDQYTRALGQFERARKLNDSHPAPVVGLVQAKLGSAGIPAEYASAPGDTRLRQLHRLLDESLRRSPNYGQTHLQVGKLYLIAGEPAAAEAGLGRAVQLLARNAEAHSALAVSRLAQGRKAEAVSGFERAANLDQKSVAHLTNLGAAYLTVGDAARATTVFRRALNLAPKDARIHSDLGTALLGTNEVAQALPHLRQAVLLEPARATFRNNLGYALQRTEDLPGAIKEYQEAIRLAPQLGSAWINLGTAHATRRKFQSARAAFEKAAAIDPTDPRVKANLDELDELERQR